MEEIPGMKTLQSYLQQIPFSHCVGMSCSCVWKQLLRGFAWAAVLCTLVMAVRPDVAYSNEEAKGRVGDPVDGVRGPAVAAVPLIHQTDLFHPHNDPDDHWDLAAVYALALRGKVNLQAVVLDHPTATMEGEPACVAIAQMNHITGLSVPFAVGSPVPFGSQSSAQFASSISHSPASDLILDILERSPSPVIISIAGSARDVAVAGTAAPDLFRGKCKGIYLNAGTGTTDPTKGANTEYNVRLGLDSYRAIFELPCPIYWLPCFETLAGGEMKVERYGSYWFFTQGDILPSLRMEVQNFFLYALNRETDAKWLRYLSSDVDQVSLEREGKRIRNMWCTAGFHHLAGLTILRDGTAIPRGENPSEEVFSFDPILVRVGETGVESWEPSSEDTDRYIITVRDVENYALAMTSALKELLLSL